MNAEILCYGCMKEKENAEDVCPYCGFEQTVYEVKRSTRALPLGTILNGKYLLGKVLGEGGFGITYLALDLNFEMPVAIKEYFPVGLASRDTTADGGNTESVSVITGEKRKYYEYGIRSFSSEARNLGKFQKTDGVISVKDFFQENETAYLVMEYIDGKSLKQYLEERKEPLSEEETLRLIRPVLNALAKIHEEGIIHRDISPENIMIADDGQVVLIDFGAARISTGVETKSLTVLLKHGYAPVEQYQTKGKQGPWTDIYAICATMYRMMSGKKPEEAIDRMVNDEVIPLAERSGISVSSRVSAAIEKGLAVQGEKRYQTIEELMQDLYLIDDAPQKKTSSVDYEEQIVRTTNWKIQNREVINEYEHNVQALIRENEKREIKKNEKETFFFQVCTTIVLLVLLIAPIVMRNSENDQKESSEEAIEVAEFDDATEVEDVRDETEATEYDDVTEVEDVSDETEATEFDNVAETKNFKEAIEVTEYNNAEELVRAIEDNSNIEFDHFYEFQESWHYFDTENLESIYVSSWEDGSLAAVSWDWDELSYLSVKGVKIGTDKQDVENNNALGFESDINDEGTSIVYKMPTDSKVMEVTIDYNADDKVEQLMVFY